MRSLLVLLVLSIAFQGIQCGCYSNWQSSEYNSYYYCTAPEGTFYLQLYYPKKEACLIASPSGCTKYANRYFPNCIEGYQNIAVRCEAKCPDGYYYKQSSNYICMKKK